MKEEAVFRLSSLTKSIVSVAALKLVEQGKLKLDDPVSKWLPYFKPKNADGSEAVITIKNLLNHTSGLSYLLFEGPTGPYHQLGVSDGLSNSNLTLEENMKKLSQAPLVFKPGSSWLYSMSLDVLGAVIEKVTKTNLEAAIKNLVTSPLKMKNTMFVAPESLALATPYANKAPEPEKMTDGYKNKLGESVVTFSPSRAHNKKAFPSGGSGMVGSADDYITFLEAVRTNKILTKKTTDEIYQNSTGSHVISLAGPGWGWGLISALLVDPATAKMPMAEKSLGWSGVYGHTWWLDPKNELSVVILTNTSFEGMAGKFPEEIRQAVYKNL